MKLLCHIRVGPTKRRTRRPEGKRIRGLVPDELSGVSQYPKRGIEIVVAPRGGEAGLVARIMEGSGCHAPIEGGIIRGLVPIQ
jgi:hypothetical protein